MKRCWKFLKLFSQNIRILNKIIFETYNLLPVLKFRHLLLRYMNNNITIIDLKLYALYKNNFPKII